ncbi:hypothetical protein [Shewanella algae]|uniref:hypothetical protein n=1 Tax=Shewanella algae TaxID=38313 RepID=UPI0011869742|nr:hypothetical protein [Shewanella algae]TVP05475.1 hypothetical protein AYI73_14030 [Shewanella algae]BCV42346.1 hypothetical protein TUM17378_36080 [Shewanella algae]
MIISIHDSIIEGVLQDNPHCTSFMDDVLSARRKGIILIDIRKKSVLKLLELYKNGTNNKTLKVIRGEISFQNEIIEAYGIKRKFAFFETHENEGNLININGYFGEDQIKLRLLNAPRLVLENISDDCVYKKIIEWELSKGHIPSCFRINYDIIQGGGATTAAICENLISEGYLTYSLCDSDKMSPFCSIGDTANETSQTFINNNIISNFYVIDVHEVENLIPIHILNETANETQLPAIDFIRRLLDIEPRLYSYYDLKESIKYSYIHSNLESGNYWKGIFSQLEGFDIERNDNTKITNRLSSMLPHAIARLENSNISYQTKIEPESLVVNWSNIAEKLVSWFITRKPITIS